MKFWEAHRGFSIKLVHGARLRRAKLFLVSAENSWHGGYRCPTLLKQQECLTGGWIRKNRRNFGGTDGGNERWRTD